MRLLGEKGITSRMIPAGSSFNSCPTVMTYTARWSWDFTIYMSLAELVVYQNAAQVGSAVYDSRYGGLRFDKWGNAEDKISLLVDELFPDPL